MMRFPKWKNIAIAGVCLLAVYLCLPNIIKSPPSLIRSLLPENAVNLGLDLQGGSYLLLEVDFPSYIREQLDNVRNDVRDAFRGRKVDGKTVRYAGGLQIGNEDVSLTLEDSTMAEGVVQLLREQLPSTLSISRDNAHITIGYTKEEMERIRLNVLEQSVEIVRRRIDELGTKEPDIQRQGSNRIILQVPGLQNPEQLKRLLGKTAKLTFHLLDETAPYVVDNPMGTPVPPDAMRLKLYNKHDKETSTLYHTVKRKIILSGDMLVHAQATYSEGTPVVTFRFNNLGAKKFGDVTKANVDKPFAIVLDNQVISAPVIREPILGGSGQISGNFSVEEANDLAILLRAGALPAPLHIAEERTVGPSLGADSIVAGKKAMVSGTLLVAMCMLLFYGLFGIFANIALLINIILIFAVLSFLSATLTLPGIAGIVLTVGMAVDANVLIFERIKEEIRLGKSPLAAIDHGFKHAFTTIFDANITTLIAAIILFNFGTGPIKGFAVTLSIGILTSMFSAITLTRFMVDIWVRKVRPSTLAF